MGVLRILAAAALVVALAAGSAEAQRGKAPRTATPDLGAMLRDAQNYTVKVRATVTWPMPGDSFGMAQGTGFVIDKQLGWILTNAHVARRSPAVVEISFGDAETAWIPVQRVYVDNNLDIAVLKLAADKAPATLTQARLGCDRKIEQGSAVVAYGHPRDLNFTATRGIVSSVRSLGYQEFVQLDASLNPGNSGGALLSVDTAEVIGVTTANVGSGLGLAVPIRHVCPIVSLLRSGKDPTVPTLPVYWLSSGNSETLTVARAFPNAPQDFALRSGDEVLGVAAGQKFSGLPDLYTALRGSGQSIPLAVRRAGAETQVDVPVIAPTPILARKALAVAGMLIAAPTELDSEASALPQLRVQFIKSGEDAERAGFRSGDMLETVGDERFDSLEALQTWLAGRTEGEVLKVLVRRRSASSRGTSAQYVRLELPYKDMTLLEGGK